MYPKWPKDLAERYFPDCDGEEGVSHPKAREVPGRRGLPGSEERQRFRTKKFGGKSWRGPSLPGPEQVVSEGRQIFRCCEQTGMSGHTAQNAGVLILHFALDNLDDGS